MSIFHTSNGNNFCANFKSVVLKKTLKSPKQILMEKFWEHKRQKNVFF